MQPTFDPEVVRDFFEQQLQEGRTMAASLRAKRQHRQRAEDARDEVPATDGAGQAPGQAG